MLRAVRLERLPRVLVRRNRGRDHGRARLAQLGRDERRPEQVLVPLLGREAEFGGELGADRVAEEERDGAPGLLVERDLEGASDGVLARVDEAGEDEGEALLVSRGVGFTEDFDDGVVGEPVGDGLGEGGEGCERGEGGEGERKGTNGSGLQAVSEFGAADVEGLDTGGDLVGGLVVVRGGNVGHLLRVEKSAGGLFRNELFVRTNHHEGNH